MAPTNGGTERSQLRERLRRPRNRLLLSAAILLAIVGFVWFRLDWRGVVAAVARADPLVLAVGVVAAAAGLVCWSEAMRHLLPPGSGGVSRRRSFLVYAAGSLVRRTIPLGYAGSIGVLAFLFGREASLPFDRSLASVSAAEFVNMVVSTALAVLGVMLLVRFGPPSPYVRWLALGALGLVLGAAVVGALLVYRRSLVERSASASASGLAALAGRLPAHLSVESVERAVDRYLRSLSTISTRRGALAASVGYSLLAWLALVVALYASGLAVGYRVPIAVALIVVPVGGYASILPVPGGLGGYELGVAGAIALLGGVEVATALALTLLFRVCSYWFVVGVGVVAAAALSVDFREVARAANEQREDDAGVGSGPSEP